MNYEIAWKMLKHILEDPTWVQAVLCHCNPEKHDGGVMAIREVDRLMARIEEEYEEIEEEESCEL